MFFFFIFYIVGFIEQYAIAALYTMLNLCRIHLLSNYVIMKLRLLHLGCIIFTFASL